MFGEFLPTPSLPCYYSKSPNIKKDTAEPSEEMQDR